MPASYASAEHKSPSMQLGLNLWRAASLRGYASHTHSVQATTKRSNIGRQAPPTPPHAPQHQRELHVAGTPRQPQRIQQPARQRKKLLKRGVVAGQQGQEAAGGGRGGRRTARAPQVQHLAQHVGHVHAAWGTGAGAGRRSEVGWGWGPGTCESSGRCGRGAVCLQACLAAALLGMEQGRARRRHQPARTGAERVLPLAPHAVGLCVQPLERVPLLPRHPQQAVQREDPRPPAAPGRGSSSLLGSAAKGAQQNCASTGHLAAAQPLPCSP